MKGTENKEAEVQFKNKKIVVWLLNRSQSQMKEEREAFFARVNTIVREAAEAEAARVKAMRR